MSRRVLVAGGILLALALSWAAASYWGGADGLRTAEVTRQDLPLLVEAQGRLEAAVAYEIGPPSVPETWNYNLTWMIPEGRRVKEGDIVARFDATAIEEQLRDYQAQLETVRQEREKEQRNLEVTLEELRLDVVKAENELEKLALDLSLDESLLSAIEIKELRLEKQLATDRLAFLREKMASQRQLVDSKLELLDVKTRYFQGKVEQLRSVIEKYAVRAPISGLVLYVPKRNGERWEVGESVWMLAKILKVADVSTLRVEAQVLEVDAARVRPGQRAEVSLDAVPGSLLTTQVAEVGRIVREKSYQDRTKIFDVFLPIEAIDTEEMRPGMGVSVTIETAVLDDRLTVPTDAVRASAEGPYVEIRTSGGRFERRAVTLGERTAERVVVLSGVSESDVVLLGNGEDRS